MYELILNNYTELFNKHCKNNNKYKIVNSCTCEDIFNDKILFFIESDIKHPTESMLKSFLKTKVKTKAKKYIGYSENYVDIESERSCIEYNQEYVELDEKINLLFIDYRPKKKSKRNATK